MQGKCHGGEVVLYARIGVLSGTSCGRLHLLPIAEHLKIRVRVASVSSSRFGAGQLECVGLTLVVRTYPSGSHQAPNRFN